MSTKFEQLLDFLVNEETDKANELFHEIVVEKSREIYENLIAEEEEEAKKEEETKESADSDEDEGKMEEDADSDEDEGKMEEGYGFEGAEEEEAFPVQDETGDFEKDTADHDAMGDMGDEFDGEEGGEEAATKDDVLDLKDALEELKAEFEALMAGEKHEEEENPDVHGGALDAFGDEESEEDGEEADDEEEEEEGKGNPFAESKTPKSQGEKMREYIEKVTATMDGGLVGGRTGETVPAPKEGKSPISSGSGKPTSGANASNIATDTKTHDEDGTAPKGKVGGLVKKGGDVPHAGNFLNTEKSGQKAKGMFAQAKKPANGEGKPVGAGSGQSNVTGATNTKSIESGK